MALSARVNRVMDIAHKVTVGVLATSAVYFTVEIFRATWHIQEKKFEARQGPQAGQAEQHGGAGSAGKA